MKWLSYLIVFLFLLNFSAPAQENMLPVYPLNGSVTDAHVRPLPGVQVMLIQADTLVTAAITNEKGDFILERVQKGAYQIRLSMLGFKSIEKPVHISRAARLSPFLLEEDTVALDEIVVKADRRDLIAFQAGSAAFHLSTEALRAQDAFEALREIPKLTIDETTREIKLNDGRTPLILIDGINRPGLLSSLNPADIETVEIIDQASARYRGNQAGTCIVNIKMKKGRQRMYVDGYVYSRHEVEGVFGITGGSIAAGNKKTSFYLNLQQFYFHHDDKEMDNTLVSGDLVRHLNGNNRYTANDLRISGGGDWLISDRDYLAYHLAVATNPYHVEVDMQGTADRPSSSVAPKVSALAGQKSFSFEEGLSSSKEKGVTGEELHSAQKVESNYFTHTYGLYYRHTFADDRHWEATANVGFYDATSDGDRKETSNLYAYTTRIDLKNAKRSFELDLNYDFSVAGRLLGNVGANTYFQRTKTDDRADPNPLFNYKDWTEYIYADIRNKTGERFSYQLSVGLDWVRANAAGQKNSYINWVPSLSLAYQLSSRSHLQFNLSRERISPPISTLNPCNTSTDSLRLMVGNPYLKPYIDNGADLRYTFSGKGIYVEPYLTYDYYTDLIEPTGTLQGNVYRQTYENKENQHRLRTGITTRWALSTFGNINIGTYYRKDFIRPCPYSGNGWGANGFLYVYYKKVSLSVNVTYEAASYTRTEKKWATPESEALLTWNLPRNWRLQGSLRYFAAGNNRSLDRIRDGNYHYDNRVLYHDRYLMPMIGISYVFHKSGSTKQRQTKQIDMRDNGLQGIKVE